MLRSDVLDRMRFGMFLRRSEVLRWARLRMRRHVRYRMLWRLSEMLRQMRLLMLRRRHVRYRVLLRPVEMLHQVRFPMLRRHVWHRVLLRPIEMLRPAHLRMLRRRHVRHRMWHRMWHRVLLRRRRSVLGLRHRVWRFEMMLLLRTRMLEVRRAVVALPLRLPREPAASDNAIERVALKAPFVCELVAGLVFAPLARCLRFCSHCAPP